MICGVCNHILLSLHLCPKNLCPYSCKVSLTRHRSQNTHENVPQSFDSLEEAMLSYKCHCCRQARLSESQRLLSIYTISSIFRYMRCFTDLFKFSKQPGPWRGCQKTKEPMQWCTFFSDWQLINTKQHNELIIIVHLTSSYADIIS